MLITSISIWFPIAFCNIATQLGSLDDTIQELHFGTQYSTEW